MAKQKVQEQEQVVEKLSRAECANKVVRTWLDSSNGDTTIDELSETADKMFVAGRGGDADYSDVDTMSWHVQKVLESLQNLNLVSMEWHCAVHPNVRLDGNGDK